MKNSNSKPALTKSMVEDELTMLSTRCDEIRVLITASNEMMDHEIKEPESRFPSQHRLDGIHRLVEDMTNKIADIQTEWLPILLAHENDVKTGVLDESKPNPRKIQQESTANPAIAA